MDLDLLQNYCLLQVMLVKNDRTLNLCSDNWYEILVFTSTEQLKKNSGMDERKMELNIDKEYLILKEHKL